MAQPLDQLKQSISADINGAVSRISNDLNTTLNRAVVEINENTARTVIELSVQVGLVKTQLEEMRAMIATKTKTKKTEGEAPAATPDGTPAAAAPAAKPKGKKDNASAWFKAKYVEDEAMRTRVNAMPEVAKLMGEMADELGRKKSNPARYTAIATAILRHHPAIAQAEFATNNNTPLVPADSPTAQ